MLMASGANFGFRRTVPHMLGVSLGFVLMAFLVGVGLAGLFQTYPVAQTALKVISVLKFPSQTRASEQSQQLILAMNLHFESATDLMLLITPLRIIPLK
jgi:hypothetical protein